MTKTAVFTMGGTIAMQQSKEVGAKEDGDFLITKPSESSVFLQRLKSHPISNYDWFEICNYDSINLTAEHWQKLNQLIIDKANEYQNIIVIHGTDTLAYSACSSGLVLRDFWQNAQLKLKRVVFTGSMIPLVEAESDGWDNLNLALKTAQNEALEGVFIAFGNGVFTPWHCEKTNYSLQSFDFIINNPTLALPAKDKGIFNGTIYNEFADKILFLKAAPNFAIEAVIDLIQSKKVNGIAIQPHLSLTLNNLSPPSFVDLTRAACQRDIPVIITHSYKPIAWRKDWYESSVKLWQSGALFAADMTLAAAIVKLQWLLAIKKRNYDLPEFGKLWQINVAGERLFNS